MPYRLMTDSTCDLGADILQELDVSTLKLRYNLDGQEYDDGDPRMDAPAFYAKIRQGHMPTTTLINTERFIEAFSELAAQGEDVLYLAFSSALSGTCACAMQAAEQVREQYPQRKIYVVDTLCASLGEGLLVYHSAKLKQQGMGIDELSDWVEANKLRVVHWFTVDDIRHLYRGGRVNRATAVLGTLLQIKPVLHVDDQGRLINMEKGKGRRRALATIVERVLERKQPDQPNSVFISHGDALEEAEQVAAMVREQLPDAFIYINYVGTVIGTHSGPGTMAIFCFGDGHNR